MMFSPLSMSDFLEKSDDEILPPPTENEIRSLVYLPWLDQKYRYAGLADDIRYYGRWMRDEADKRIGHLYPKAIVTNEMARARRDLARYAGRLLPVIAWLWARTVLSPNPAFADVEVPLASTFILSKKLGKGAYVEPVQIPGGYRFTVKAGTPPESAWRGTKLARGAHFQCLMSGAPMSPDYIKAEGMAGRMDARMMAVVAEGDRERVYLSPTPEHETVLPRAEPVWMPDVEIPPDRRSMFTPLYGLTHFKHLFTDRQLVAMTTFSDLPSAARERIIDTDISASEAAGTPDDGLPPRQGGTGATAYADAITTYLGLAVGRLANASTTINRWSSDKEKIVGVFSRQAIPMVWDYAEANPFSSSTQNWMGQIEWVAKNLKNFP